MPRETSDINLLEPPPYNLVANDAPLADHFNAGRFGVEQMDPSSSLPAYSYHEPSTYAIGLNKNIPSLVSIDQLKTHLALLRAFRELRSRVENTVIGDEANDTGIVFEGDEADGTEATVRKMSSDARWAWIVGLAVER